MIRYSHRYGNKPGLSGENKMQSWIMGAGDTPIVACDVVEWPRNSQVIRLEKEQATHSYHVMRPGVDGEAEEVAIFYNLHRAAQFCDKYGYWYVEPRPILGE